LLYAGDVFPQSDEICCTWINTDYTSSERPQKMIFNYDGTFETYRSKETQNPIIRGVFQIDQKWTDTEGSIWYKIKMFDMYGTQHNLVRIDKDGDKLEFMRKPHAYPESIDSDASNYSAYSRTVLKSFEEMEK
jgi:hypothetical protein